MFLTESVFGRPQVLVNTGREGARYVPVWQGLSTSLTTAMHHGEIKRWALTLNDSHVQFPSSKLTLVLPLFNLWPSSFQHQRGDELLGDRVEGS